MHVLKCVCFVFTIQTITVYHCLTNPFTIIIPLPVWHLFPKVNERLTFRSSTTSSRPLPRWGLALTTTMHGRTKTRCRRSTPRKSSHSTSQSHDSWTSTSSRHESDRFPGPVPTTPTDQSSSSTNNSLSSKKRIAILPRIMVV